jgi:hypothetical protein
VQELLPGNWHINSSEVRLSPQFPRHDIEKASRRETLFDLGTHLENRLFEMSGSVSSADERLSSKFPP